MKMMYSKSVKTIFTILLFALCFASCDKDDNSSSSRVVKYELSGTYSAPLQVIYTNEDGALQSVNDVILPWSKEVTVKAGVTGVGLTASFQTVDSSMVGRTLIGKILVGGVEKQSASVFANSSGAIDLSTLFHVF
jgi:hypothetical protein